MAFDSPRSGRVREGATTRQTNRVEHRLPTHSNPRCRQRIQQCGRVYAQPALPERHDRNRSDGRLSPVAVFGSTRTLVTLPPSARRGRPRPAPSCPKAQVDRDNLCYAILNELGVNIPRQWHDLRGLETEGAAYAQWVMTLPIGFSYTFSADRGNGRPWHMTLTGLYRFTRTDRLDDIESQYANPWEMSPLGLGLSSQSNPSDIPPCANATNISTYQYQQGLSAERQAIRGNSATRDAYWTLGLTLAKSLTASTSNVFHKKRFRGQKVVNKR